MNYWKIKIHFIASEIFHYSFAAYLILLFAETIKEGFVTFFFNLNILLIIVLLSGIVMIVTDSESLKRVLDTDKSKKRINKKEIIFITLLALISASIIFYKTFSLGVISLIISGIAAVIIVLVSVLVFLDKE